MSKENQEDFFSDALFQLIRRINAAQNTSSLVHTISEGVCQCLQASVCEVFHYDTKWRELYTLGHEEEVRFSLGQGVAGFVGESGQALLVPDVSQEKIYLAEVDVPAQAHEVGSIISAPMRNLQGVLVGVIQAVHPERSGFQEGDEEQLRLIAEQAGAAMERVDAFDAHEKFSSSLAESFAAGLDNRQLSTIGHSSRVQRMAVTLAENMKLAPEEIRQLSLAAFLHDLGRIEGTGDVLEANKTISARLREHVLYTEAVLRNITFPPHLKAARTMAMQVHERLDGKGYPRGATAREISTAASILSLVNQYDALTTQGQDGKKCSNNEALEILQEGASSRFHPEVLTVFIEQKIYEMEKRGHTRFPYEVSLKVAFLQKEETGSEGGESEAVDISEGGLSFKWHYPIPQYTPLELTIHLPTQDARAIAKVARNIQVDDAYHVGVYFLWNEAF